MLREIWIEKGIGPGNPKPQTVKGPPIRIFLGIHIDTVYGIDHPFQRVESVDGNMICGTGGDRRQRRFWS